VAPPVKSVPFKCRTSGAAVKPGGVVAFRKPTLARRFDHRLRSPTGLIRFRVHLEVSDPGTVPRRTSGCICTKLEIADSVAEPQSCYRVESALPPSSQGNDELPWRQMPGAPGIRADCQ
jgi:hypothetical protein